METENTKSGANTYEQPLKQPAREKIIQPLNPSAGDTTPTRDSSTTPQVDLSSVYPTPQFDHVTTDSHRTPSQAFALTVAQAKYEESNKLVCMRVKTLLVVCAILGLSSIYDLIVSLSYPGAIVYTIGSIIQILATLLLLTTKNHHTASLVLKIFLVLQVITFFLSIPHPADMVVGGICVLLIGYAYGRVRSLSFY